MGSKEPKTMGDVEDIKEAQIESNIEFLIEGFLRTNGVKDFESLDSLSILELVMSLEDTFDVTIPIDVVENTYSKAAFVDKTLRVITGELKC